MGLSLPERLRLQSDAVCGEAAGEIERCWGVEQQFAFCQAGYAKDVEFLHGEVEKRDAEIERLKAAKDHAAIRKAFLSGFRAGCFRFAPILQMLLAAPADDTEDHHHGEG